MVCAAALIGWSAWLPRMSALRAMQVALLAMLAVCAGIGLLNNSSDYSMLARWMIGACTAALIMVESGFTPAALVWLTPALGPQTGRRAPIGPYSVILGVAPIHPPYLPSPLA